MNTDSAVVNINQPVKDRNAGKKGSTGTVRYLNITRQSALTTPLSKLINRHQYDTQVSSGGSRKFWWGGILSTKPQNSDAFTEIESDFSAEIGNSNVFFAQNQVVSKKKKKKKKKRSSPKLRVKIQTFFSPKIR